MAELPQRKLAYELRIAIDRAMRSPQPRFLRKVTQLVEENPRGAGSRHVTHNLGRGRRAYLARLAASQNGHSLAREGHDEEA
jgi:hypothetical protein